MEAETITAPQEASPEAAEILRAAGWQPHDMWNVFTRGTLVMGFAPNGSTFHVKDWAKISPGHPRYSEDTPDTPEEAAAWLVRLEENKKKISPPATSPATSPSESELAGAHILDGPYYEPEIDNAERAPMTPPADISIQVNPVFNVSGTGAGGAATSGDSEAGAGGQSAAERQAIADATALFDDAPEAVADVEDEAHSETGAEAATPSYGQADAAGFAVDKDADSTTSENEASADYSTQDREERDSPLFSESDPIDADFSEPTAEDLAELEALESAGDLSGDLLEDRSEAVPQPVDDGTRFYYGDNFDTMKLGKIGRLTIIAAEKVAAELAFATWSEEEFKAVQSHVASHLAPATGAYVGDRQDIYNRFVELSEAQAMVSTINRHRDQSVAYLSAAETPRVLVEEFDPEANWPA